MATAAAMVISFTMAAGCGNGDTPSTQTHSREAGFGRSLSKVAGKANELVMVAAGGDVNFGDGVTPYLTSNGVDYPWANVSDLFSSANIGFVNLECCISTGGTPVPEKEYCFRGPPDAVGGMARAGVDIVSLANNHSKDYGTGALLDTFTYLEGSGVRWCGGGKDAGEAYECTGLTVHGKTVGFLAFNSIVPSGWPATADSPGCATTWDEERVADSIKSAKSECDYVVSSFHWGIELQTSPTGEQRNLAHLAVDSGADLVLGHHPHVVQGFELYRDRLIAYSLGNFIFSPPREISSKTVLLIATIGPEGLVQAKITPVVIRNCRPVLMEGSQARSWLDTVSGYSQNLGTDISIRGGSGFIDRAQAPDEGTRGILKIHGIMRPRLHGFRRNVSRLPRF
ncbi:MAG: CapA family protein [Actinobacteria bacterium]|nr:CapA family protein [Actinomycetota bacterium]MCG2819864.1 CapA family protein [Actinomycetes bacterium]MBU4178999.1 CapA family protein [Actinomycetota bacterium]MBU4219151.1 CapA family protein [Actinomycetota bacterium]MBU4358438.1 CapA family protein [Actinomycetota bacterium]